MKKFALLFLSVFALNSLHADEEVHFQTAARLLEVTGGKKMLDEVTMQLHGSVLSRDPNLAEYDNVIQAYLTKVLAWEDLKDDMARVYVGLFTQEELSQVADFYSSEAGQKFVRSSRLILGQSLTVAKEKVQATLPMLQEMIHEEIRRRETVEAE